MCQKTEITDLLSPLKFTLLKISLIDTYIDKLTNNNTRNRELLL